MQEGKKAGRKDGRKERKEGYLLSTILQQIEFA